MSFPEKLKALRLKNGLTQEEFEPDIKTIIDISSLFNVTTDELLK